MSGDDVQASLLQLSLLKPELATSLHSVWVNFRRIEAKVSLEAYSELKRATAAIAERQHVVRRRTGHCCCTSGSMTTLAVVLGSLFASAQKQVLSKRMADAEAVCRKVQALTEDMQELVTQL